MSSETHLTVEGRRPGRPGHGGQLTFLKLRAEVTNCIIHFINKIIIFCVVSNNKCIYHLHQGPFPIYCINNQLDFKQWAKISVTRYVTKLDF